MIYISMHLLNNILGILFTAFNSSVEQIITLLILHKKFTAPAVFIVNK